METKGIRRILDIYETKTKTMEENLKLAIDSESINIYIDNGDEQDPTHVCYWHIEEWEEDSEVAISIFNAIDLFHTNPKELLNKILNN